MLEATFDQASGQANTARMRAEVLAITPKERVEQLQRIYEEGGDKALSEFANTNTVEFVRAIEAIYIVEGDDEGLEEFQADWSEAIRSAVADAITQNGFVGVNEMVRICRENGMDDTADKIASYLQRLRN